MNTISVETTVAQLVIDQPGLTRIFDKLGIDYCCGGKKPLREACAKRGLDPETVVQTINAYAAAGGMGGADATDWSRVGLTELCDHIGQTHHSYLTEELPRLGALVNKVATVHGGRLPHLQQVREVFSRLRDELLAHTEKEEQTLFPLIRKLDADESGEFGGTNTPDISNTSSASDTFNTFNKSDLSAGAVADLIERMEAEHDEAGDDLSTLRELTNGYAIPVDACGSHRAMLSGLEDLERDTHQHIHKENNILFPKAMEKEAALSARD